MKSKFNRKALFTIVGGAVLINPAFAQEQSSGELEEIVVTGLRGSLMQSMEIKRDAIGVVDAISAEDIGKFPDTNLAESLQRITGISIDRRNGEGAQVTARGFGPQFNLVTLNGRTMPAADAFGTGVANIGGFGPQGRSFNFANLASEAISGLEVYKTGRADIASGGIGATVNIKTARPFDNDGLVANVSAKGVYDDSAPFDSEVTPEIAGIFSYTSDDRRWGVGLSASYQERKGGAVEYTVNDWAVAPWPSTLLDTGVTRGFSEDTIIENAPNVGDLVAIPDDIRYAFSDVERERVNAQGVVQFAPADNLTMTLDYTLARNEVTQRRGEQTMWLQQDGVFSHVIFDTNEDVRTPIYLFENTSSSYRNKDFGYEQQLNAQKNELDSIGFNVDWQVTDRLSLALDMHTSEAKSLPNDSVTGGSSVLFSFAGVPCPQGNCVGWVAQEFNFSGALPVASRYIYPTEADMQARTNGDAQRAWGPGELGSQMLRVGVQQQETEIDQARIDGSYEFDNGRFQFGIDVLSQEVNQRSSNNQMTLGNWGADDAGAANVAGMVDLLTPYSLVGLFDDFNPGTAPRQAWRGDAVQLAQWAFGSGGYGNWDAGSGTPNGTLRYNPIWGNNDTIKEDINAAYVQLALNGEIHEMPVNLVLGLRYEETEVESSSLVSIPSAIVWASNNDFSIPRSADPADRVTFTEEAEYNHILPSLNFDIGLTDTLKGRVSYGKTMARAPIGNLVAGANPGGPRGSTLLVGIADRGGGNANNPGLLPYESLNLDLSLEWYFSDSGYISAGYWDKEVDNFIGNSVVQMPLYGLTDPTAGPDAQAALAFLQDNNIPATDTTLFSALALLRYETLDLATFNQYRNTPEVLESRYDIVGEADDPLYIFNVNRPVNQQKARIHGWEFGGQYFFGDTGFGVLANYTLVKGDVAFDNGGDPNVNQFALLGLSDTANVVLMYENYGFTARLAYNWRDEFLTAANLGGSRNPRYVEEYEQIDLSVAYDINESLSVQFEGLNLTGEDIRWHGRSSRQAFRVEDQSPRYAVGVRYKF